VIIGALTEFSVPLLPESHSLFLRRIKVQVPAIPSEFSSLDNLFFTIRIEVADLAAASAVPTQRLAGRNTLAENQLAGRPLYRYHERE
jgi:hypothetical protein